MGHLAARSGYRSLVERLNRCPQGAPSSELLYQILEILFSPREAELVSRLPIKPFGVKTAARAWSVSEAEAREVLDRLASRAILLDLERNGTPLYVLPPPMAGFFEFSMMRLRGDVDQKRLGELFYEYINVEEDFIRDLLRARRAPSSVGCSSRSGRCRRRSPSGSSTTSGRARPCARRTGSRSASATAATRWSTSVGPARPAARSA